MFKKTYAHDTLLQFFRNGYHCAVLWMFFVGQLLNQHKKTTFIHRATFNRISHEAAIASNTFNTTATQLRHEAACGMWSTSCLVRSLGVGLLGTNIAEIPLRAPRISSSIRSCSRGGSRCSVGSDSSPNDCSHWFWSHGLFGHHHESRRE